MRNSNFLHPVRRSESQVMGEVSCGATTACTLPPPGCPRALGGGERGASQINFHFGGSLHETCLLLVPQPPQGLADPWPQGVMHMGRNCGGHPCGNREERCAESSPYVNHKNLQFTWVCVCCVCCVCCFCIHLHHLYLHSTLCIQSICIHHFASKAQQPGGGEGQSLSQSLVCSKWEGHPSIYIHGWRGLGSQSCPGTYC